MHEETEAHLFIHCTISSSIWHLTKCNVNLSSDLNFESWLKLNCEDDTTSHLGIPHSCLFIYTLWHLWMGRNDCTFNSKTPSLEIIAKKAISSAAEFFYIATNTTLGPPNLLSPSLSNGIPLNEIDLLLCTRLNEAFEYNCSLFHENYWRNMIRESCQVNSDSWQLHSSRIAACLMQILTKNSISS
ncbi:reverse transcriptase [Senna tora]|uniref:Reverse transcriptase n=1 Tax=Senna tora TaxID=362788 RepID=A0A834SQ05_9FABA|nr:reverse transcriptase [Senna tora]